MGARKEKTPFATLRSAIERDTMVSKEPQPVQAWRDTSGRAEQKCAQEKWQLRAMARQGGSLYHEKPPERYGTRRNSYETETQKETSAILLERRGAK